MQCTKSKRLSYTDQAKKIVQKLTLEEKTFLMSGNENMEDMLELLNNDESQHYNFTPVEAGGIIEKDIPSVRFCDGPRGVVCNIGKSTCFPVSMLRGATFNPALEEQIGHAIGKEVRAYGGNFFGGVCINLPYNPGWGRSQETYGEETYHLGQMGAALVRGVQKENVIACVKHYAFNQMEISRFKVNVECDKRTEREVFLPHFKDCIDAGAASVMSSYNLYQSTYCGHHKYLLGKVLKEEWDFDGFVMSDFIWGVRDTVEAANGGQDLEMCVSTYFEDKLAQAVKDGFVPEEKVDEAVTRILRTVLAFEEAYHQSPKADETVIGCEEHISLALQCAREGITLIQNKNQVLPLEKTKHKRIAVVGKLARMENLGDHGSSQVYPAYVVTPLAGLKKVAPDVEFIYCDGTDIIKTREEVKKADAAVFVVGYNYDDEGEYVSENENDRYLGAVGGDRQYSLGLHKDEVELIQNTASLNSNSVVILIGGNTIMIHEWKEKVSSIVMGYYPGQEGGRALAEIIFGDENPSGKLPFVIPEKESDLPQVKWDTASQYYGYYHGYTNLEKEGREPDVHYGFGMSYTAFSISEAKFFANDEKITAECIVTNIGQREGDEVIQMYVGFKNSAVDRPVKQLRGFCRVHLASGENRHVSISCSLEKLCWYNPYTEQMELEQMEYEVYIGSSSDNKDLLQGIIKL